MLSLVQRVIVHLNYKFNFLSNCRGVLVIIICRGTTTSSRWGGPCDGSRWDHSWLRALLRRNLLNLVGILLIVHNDSSLESFLSLLLLVRCVLTLWCYLLDRLNLSTTLRLNIRLLTISSGCLNLLLGHHNLLLLLVIVILLLNKLLIISRTHLRSPLLFWYLSSLRLSLSPILRNIVVQTHILRRLHLVKCSSHLLRSLWIWRNLILHSSLGLQLLFLLLRSRSLYKLGSHFTLVLSILIDLLQHHLIRVCKFLLSVLATIRSLSSLNIILLSIRLRNL